eukprot:3637797-Rhodomonas_salina.1
MHEQHLKIAKQTGTSPALPVLVFPGKWQIPDGYGPSSVYHAQAMPPRGWPRSMLLGFPVLTYAYALGLSGDVAGEGKAYSNLGLVLFGKGAYAK